MSRSEPVKPIDLTGREQHLRTALRGMDKVADRFCTVGKRSLPFLQRQRGRLLAQPATVHEDTASDALEGSYVVDFRAPDGETWGLLFLDARAVSVVLDGALGAPCDGVSPEPAGALTAAQDAVVRRLVRVLAQAFANVVLGQLELELNITRFERAQPEYTPPEGGIYSFCTFEGVCGPARIGLALSIEALTTRDSAHDQLALDADSPQMVEALTQVELELLAELGTTEVPLQQVLNLKVGDVLRLNRAVDDLVCVSLGGVPKMFGSPVISRGQFAIEIREWHEL